MTFRHLSYLCKNCMTSQAVCSESIKVSRRPDLIPASCRHTLLVCGNQVKPYIIMLLYVARSGLHRNVLHCHKFRKTNCQPGLVWGYLYISIFPDGTRCTQQLCCESGHSGKPIFFPPLQMVLSCCWTWVCRQPSLVVLCSPSWEQCLTLQWSLHQVLQEIGLRPTIKLLLEWGEWRGNYRKIRIISTHTK